jgi:hypothetical protein
MPSKMLSDKQKQLFDAIAKSSTLIFEAGPEGIDVNIVGTFEVRRCGSEDRLEMGDGDFSGRKLPPRAISTLPPRAKQFCPVAKKYFFAIANRYILAPRMMLLGCSC